MNRIIFYYQTFTTLKPIIDLNVVTHIHLSAIHFGKNENGSPYIHLNDYPPDSDKFNTVWQEIQECQKKGIKIILMLGGAGGAFYDLFNSYDTYYKLLLDTIQKYNIDGIDLDIEENVDLENVKLLISDIKNDTKENFIISMAPLLSSINSDVPGMGGFVYKDLYNSKEGSFIDYFNIQSYYSYTLSDYESMINNKYPINKLVFGMIYSQPLNNCLIELNKIIDKYGKIGGVFIWEYCFADNNNPSSWANKINNTINKNRYSCRLQ